VASVQIVKVLIHQILPELNKSEKDITILYRKREESQYRRLKIDQSELLPLTYHQAF
jgi:hypothetical protein